MSYISDKRVYTFETELIVGYDKNGPISIKTNKITYAYFHSMKTLYLEGWEIFNDLVENEWVPQSLKRLHDLDPETYEKLCVLAEENNQKRLDSVEGDAEALSIESYMENEMERAGNE